VGIEVTDGVGVCFEIRRGINSFNGFYYLGSIVNPPPYSILKIIMYKVIIEPVVLYGCEVPLCMLKE
jgi:hypothetical protein